MTEDEITEKAEALLTVALESNFDDVIKQLEKYTTRRALAITLKLGGFLNTYDPYKWEKLVAHINKKAAV